MLAIRRIVTAMETDMRPSPSGRPLAFSERVSAEAWDAWFRWRDDTGLHDANIGSTWARVANALASVEGEAKAHWTHMFESLLQGWHALPDPRILAAAGTGFAPWPADELSAVVNVSTCVRDAFTPQARLDLAAVEYAAGICVRMLDNAILLVECPEGAQRLCVGLVGLADALLMLDLAYDSVAARDSAQNIAASLAQGCARESTRLAAERGTRAIANGARGGPREAQQGRRCEFPAAPQRHSQLTAITPQRQLALLANNVANALDPLRGYLQMDCIDGPDGGRVLRSSGSTLEQFERRPRTSHGDYTIDTAVNVPRSAQQAMRAAVQPWIDVSIDYPWAS
jgi:ribonucleoside-diphosphate reductase alpha chain